MTGAPVAGRARNRRPCNQVSGFVRFVLAEATQRAAVPGTPDDALGGSRLAGRIRVCHGEWFVWTSLVSDPINVLLF